MADEGATKDPGGRQPEAFPGLDAAAKAGGVRPPEQSNKAINADAPQGADLDAQEAKAADILKLNTERDTGKSA